MKPMIRMDLDRFVVVVYIIINQLFKRIKELVVSEMKDNEL